MTTSNINVSPWLLHALALAVGTVVYLGGNQEFLGLLSPTWVTLFHIAGPLAAYLGISQVTSQGTK